ncbi:MAG TPA: hypothetical protein VHM48_12345 [Candidatus Limnocylindrales bacterium]|nr:hypothetical protein [Candidatus Limnocylindrales bacterium]
MTVVLRRILVSAAVAAIVAVAAIGAARATAPTEPVHVVPGQIGVAPAPATVPVAPGAADPGDDALTAELDAVLAADQASPSAAPRAGERIAVRGQLRRLAAWRRLVHATVVVDLKAGGLTTIQLDHGTISAMTSTTLTIAEAGGGSVSVALGDETRVRRDGAKAAAADLRNGDEVFVMSKVEAGGASAYLVVVPKS